MDRKEAAAHIRFIKRAIIDLGYDCLSELMSIKNAYANNGFRTNKDLYEATSRMMCKARYRSLCKGN